MVANCDVSFDVANTPALDAAVSDFNTRAEAVLEKLEILSIKTQAPDDYDDRNIVLGDMDTVNLGGNGGAGGSDCKLDLVIQANTFTINSNSLTIDQCDTPLVIQALANSMLFTVDSTVTFTMDAADFTVDGESYRSILDRLDNAESRLNAIDVSLLAVQTLAADNVTAVATAQSTADDKVSQTEFDTHTHAFNDSSDITGSTANAGDGNTLPTHAHGDGTLTVTVSGTTSTP